jgi:hypothetical protein
LRRIVATDFNNPESFISELRKTPEASAFMLISFPLTPPLFHKGERGLVGDFQFIDG